MAGRNAHVPLQVIAVELVEVNDPAKMNERPREGVCGRQMQGCTRRCYFEKLSNLQITYPTNLVYCLSLLWSKLEWLCMSWGK